jgi:uncharacterized repeat protein (TIGR01451 family)
MRRTFARFVLVWALLSSATVHATDFDAGAVIIPMDTTYQDLGMLEAYGLLYQLLLANIPVHWVIASPKLVGDADFTVGAIDHATQAVIASHGYRGGPFVVPLANAAAAMAIVNNWIATNSNTVVHVAQQPFSGRTGRLLEAAPTIAVIADGNEDIAFKYLNAAKIPDRLGGAWDKNSPDVLTVTDVAGPTTTDHADGLLFRPSGEPAFCQIMTMHWGVNKVVDEVVAEYRSFLQFPTHMMAECQAVNAIENNIFGRFLTPNGFVIDNAISDKGPFSFINSHTPFGQFDGTYELVSGSERAYSLPPGDVFYDQGVVMIKDATTPIGERSIWMTGYIDGLCDVEEGESQTCTAGVGKVSYLGGHKYETKVPISANPDSQGTRLFLNSLFEASCATSEGQPFISINLDGPTTTTTSDVSYTINYLNLGSGSALNVQVSDTLPAGASFVSCSDNCTTLGNTITWEVGDVASGGSGFVTLDVSLSSYGTFQNSADANYTVGLNIKPAQADTVTTVYQAAVPPDSGVDAPDAGVVEGDGGNDAAAEGGAADLNQALPDTQAYLDGTSAGGDIDYSVGLDANASDGGGKDTITADAAGDAILPMDITVAVDQTLAMPETGIQSDTAVPWASDAIATIDGGTSPSADAEGIGDSDLGLPIAPPEGGCACSASKGDGLGFPWLLAGVMMWVGYLLRRRRYAPQGGRDVERK